MRVEEKISNYKKKVNYRIPNSKEDGCITCTHCFNKTINLGYAMKPLLICRCETLEFETLSFFICDKYEHQNY